MTDRRADILDAALGQFARYGLRKTSMDDVARAADLSRPGLYLHFPSKEALFVATLEHLLARTMAAVDAALAADRPWLDRIVDALAAAHFAFAHGVDPAHLDELAASARELAPDAVRTHEQAVRDALIAAIPAGPMSGDDAADLLLAVSTGLKHTQPDADAYRDRLRHLAGALLGRGTGARPA